MRRPFLNARTPSVARNLLILSDREAIVALAPVLEEFADRCEQPGALHWLPYFLDREVTRLRVPFLVLSLRREATTSAGLRAEEIDAVALLFEYRVFGLRTGIVATADAVGFNSIVAPRGRRAQVAVTAAQALVQRGASIVLSTYESADEPDVRGLLTHWPMVSWAWRERRVGRILQLGSTLDDTLARLGKATRFNLRYYRRRLIKDVGCEYVAQAAPYLQHEDLQALNASSLNPVEPLEFERRVLSASTLPGSYLCGLRASDGRWLSLIGGWRQKGTTVLYWQMNTLGFEKYSLGTAMRSFYLEHEIASGAKRLLIYGGTSHTMRHAFQEEPVADLVVQRWGLRAAALKRAAQLLGSPLNRFRHQNFVADTLRSPELCWSSWDALDFEANEAVSKPAGSRKVA